MRNQLSKNSILYENLKNYLNNSLNKLDEEIENILENSKISKKVRGKIKKLLDISSNVRNTIDETFVHSNVTESPSIIEQSYFKNELRDEILKILPNDVKFNMDVDSNSPKLYLGKNLLKSAILNIVQNSIEAISSDGEISISVKEQERKNNSSKQYLTISIVDNGIGISGDEFSKIFLPFISTKENHSGIGLYNSLNIINYFGGWIIPESIQNVKTSLTIYLPTYKEKKELENIVPFMKEEVKLLIIEDEVELITFISRSLLRYGYKIIMAKSAEEAIKLVDEKNGEFDIIFADIMLQDGNGLELSKKISQKYPKIKFVINSGFIDFNEIESELAEYGFYFIEKPYKINQLTQKISEVLKN